MTATEVKKAFDDAFPSWVRKDPQYAEEIRSEWADFLAMLLKDGHITEAVADELLGESK
jgi:hypothetical protein